MPYSKLIPILREALTTLRTQAIGMEKKWLANSLLLEQQKALKTRTPRSELPQHVVNKGNTASQAQNSEPVSKPRLLNPATMQRKPRPPLINAAWKRDLEAEMQLLARIPKM